MKHISLAEIDFSERAFKDVEFYLVYKESHFYEAMSVKTVDTFCPPPLLIVYYED